MSSVYRIGVTGPSGAGKGELSKILASLLTAKILDADEIYHSILREDKSCLHELEDNFGSEIIKDGTLDRKALASAVFKEGAEEKLSLLNKITHRYVTEKTEELISSLEEAGEKFAIIDAPLLIEADMHKKCSYTISVLADKDTRLERIILRDKITREYAEARIKKQKDDSFYTASTDFAFYNDKGKDALEAAAQEIVKIILKRKETEK